MRSGEEPRWLASYGIHVMCFSQEVQAMRLSGIGLLLTANYKVGIGRRLSLLDVGNAARPRSALGSVHLLMFSLAKACPDAWDMLKSFFHLGPRRCPSSKLTRIPVLGISVPQRRVKTITRQTRLHSRQLRGSSRNRAIVR
jgi:hypothetical protein